LRTESRNKQSETNTIGLQYMLLHGLRCRITAVKVPPRARYLGKPYECGVRCLEDVCACTTRMNISKCYRAVNAAPVSGGGGKQGGRGGGRGRGGCGYGGISRHGRDTVNHCVSICLLRCVGRQEERGSTQVFDTLSDIYLLHARL
jgi:hypothetical protein